jgi:PilZ domain-containing protein
MSKRREKRSHLAVPVRLKDAPRAALSESENACTLDVTPRGARLQSNAKLEVGDVVWVERGTHRGRFKVAWVGVAGTAKQGQIGIECIEKKFSWSSDIRAQNDEPYEEEGTATVVAAPESDTEDVPAAKENKTLRRHACKGDVDVRSESGRMLVVNGKLKDISGRGCYVLTHAPFAVKTNVLVNLRTQGLALESPGLVRASDAAGMWIDFVGLPNQDRLALQHFIENLPE